MGSITSSSTSRRWSVALRADAVFRPTGIEHVLINVADPEASARFYEKVFGSISTRTNGRIWFRVGRSRVGVVKTPDGQRAGVNHFCVSAEPFNPDAVVAHLAALGRPLR